MNTLYGHNQKAYDEVRSFFSLYGRSTVIHPTGIVKSFSPLNCQRIIRAPSLCGFHRQKISIIQCDHWYIENWSVGLDLKIMMETVFWDVINKEV